MTWWERVFLVLPRIQRSYPSPQVRGLTTDYDSRSRESAALPYPSGIPIHTENTHTHTGATLKINHFYKKEKNVGT